MLVSMRACAVVLTAVLAVVLAIAPAALAGAENSKTDTAYEIAIPAGSLSNAIKKLRAQSGISIVYEPAVANGVNVPALSGTYTVRAALVQLLEKTDIRVESANARTIVLKKGVSGAGNVSPAGQMRVASFKDSDGTSRSSESSESNADGNSMTVRDTKASRKPFLDGNADIPRTINDQQPYYIFDARAIEQSGATNVEAFLKQRLTMNTVAQTNGETSGYGSFRGNTSSINLRGLGSDKTLILVNGRRMAGVTGAAGTVDEEYQADLNGIPLSAIERIEVLPTSASGIYGGSAIGGVVNVILKRDYSGGEVRMNYDNTMNGDSAGRNVSASYGVALEDGRTHLSFNASWSDKKPLLMSDRVWILRKNMDEILSRSPTYIYSSLNPWLGSLPNIIPSSGGVTTLTLKPEYGGMVLHSRNTYVPANTSPGTSTAELASLLLANAGQWTLDFPLSTQSPTGLLRPIGVTPAMRSLHASLRRQVRPWLDLVTDFSWNENRSDSFNHPQSGGLPVPAAAPSNPFATNVRVRIVDAAKYPYTTRSQSRSVTFGALAQLPLGWTGMLDYTWSENRFDASYASTDDIAAVTADLLSGTLNPFVDTLRYPLDYGRYFIPRFYRGASRQHGVAVRGSGPLRALPWGQPNLTLGLEHRLAQMPMRSFEVAYPITVADNHMYKYYAREATTDSGYMEATLPLVKTGWLFGLHSLDLQLSGRSERYRVSAGTPYQETFYNRTPPTISYGNPTLNGQPYFSEASYTSSNYTVGLKYQPLKEVTLRVSRATAFLPPLPAQLIENPQPNADPSTVIDPTASPISPPPGCTVSAGVVRCPVQVIIGGNPNLRPQNSRSLNAGLIWEPQWWPLTGLRLNAEYYRVEQFDAIASLGAQGIVNQESVYPERVERDGTGRIALVNNSALNLYHRETEGWDLSLSYAMVTRAGRFSLHAVESIVLGLKNQYSQTQPAFDAVHFPSENGAAKYKTNATLNWESGPLALGWTARYFGAYKQYGAEGGPSFTRFGPSLTYINPQGGNTIPSQIYHDLFVGYAFDRSAGSGAGAASRLLDGLSMQLGVSNVFDKVAPLDAFYSSNYYMSPYGDIRLRSYWINIRKGF